MCFVIQKVEVNPGGYWKGHKEKYEEKICLKGV